MTRSISAMLFLLACSVAPVGHAQDDCDEEAIAAGECAGEASDGGDEPEVSGAELDTEDSGDQDMADDESDDEVAAEDDDADRSDSAEEDEAAGADLAAAGAQDEESDDDFGAEITVASDDDDGDADAASSDDPLSPSPPGGADATRPPASGPSVPASHDQAPARPGRMNTAEVVKHPPTGLQFEVPAGWKTRATAGTVTAQLPGGKSSVRFELTEHASLERHREEWEAGLGPQLTDLEVEVDAETSPVNGLQQVHSAGTATLGGRPIQWHLTLVKGGKKLLLVMAHGEDTGGIEKVYASIRQIQGPGRNSAASTNDDPPIIPDYDPGN